MSHLFDQGAFRGQKQVFAFAKGKEPGRNLVHMLVNIGVGEGQGGADFADHILAVSYLC